jgi:phage terminase small subunit
LMNNDLNERQKRFADYYIETGILVDAYKKAGYKAKNDNVASVNANLLIRNSKIKTYIDERLKPKDDARIASADEVLQYLTKAMRGEIDEEVVAVEQQGDYTSKAKIVSIQIKPKDRNDAAKSLAKRYGLLIDNVKINEDVPKVVDDLK